MITHLTIIFLAVLAVMPVYAEQQFANPSMVLQKIDVKPADFNRVSAEATIIPFEQSHSGSWQITIENKLMYANPNGNAVIRIYDATIQNKYIEVGMGSQPDHKFWVGVNLPDEGYIPATRLDKDGWYENTKTILAYGDASGLSVGNGKRIVVTSLGLRDFVVGSYSIYGMDNTSDPPAINSGTYSIEVLSGDISKNPLHYYPFYVAGGVGALIGVLLLTKRRSPS